MASLIVLWWTSISSRLYACCLCYSAQVWPFAHFILYIYSSPLQIVSQFYFIFHDSKEENEKKREKKNFLNSLGKTILAVSLMWCHDDKNKYKETQYFFFFPFQSEFKFSFFFVCAKQWQGNEIQLSLKTIKFFFPCNFRLGKWDRKRERSSCKKSKEINNVLRSSIKKMVK